MRARFRLAALAALAAALPPAPAAAGTAATYVVDPAHSDVSFQIRHFVTRVRGVFRDLAVTVVKDDANPANSSVQFTAKVESIDTGHPNRDADLRSENFFWMEKHPELTFNSRTVELVGANEYRVTGDLTMRGVTRTITLPVTFDGEMTDARGRVKAGFSTSTTLDRREFGIVWNRALEGGGLMLGDEVKVSISLEMVRQG